MDIQSHFQPFGSSAKSIATHTEPHRLTAMLWGLLLIGCLPGHATALSGDIQTDTVWQGRIVVEDDIRVTGGAALTIQAGTTINVANRTKIIAASGSKILARGTETEPVQFAPVDPDSHWWTIKAIGSGSILTLKHAEIRDGKVRFDNKADGLLEDCLLHGFKLPSTISAADAGTITLRRIHVRDYFDIHFIRSRVIVENSLFERLELEDSDALELTQARPGTLIARTTVRQTLGGNSDAIDLNGGKGVTIKECLIHTVTDKALSIGAKSTAEGVRPAEDIVVRDCLIHDAGIGIAVKDSSTVNLHDSTIVDCETGIRLRQLSPAASGGILKPSFNNIVWHHTTPLAIDEQSTYSTDHSAIQGKQPQGGHAPAAPEFVSLDADDFRLVPGSPLLGAGRDNATLGPGYPVGAQAAPSHPHWTGWRHANNQLTLELYLDSAHDYTIQKTHTLSPPTWQDWRTISNDDAPQPISLTHSTNSAKPVFFRIVTRDKTEDSATLK